MAPPFYKIENNEEASRAAPSHENSTKVDADLKAILDRQNHVSSILIKNQALLQLPYNEPEVFDGSDIAKYQSFILPFERTIEARGSCNVDRFYYLSTICIVSRVHGWDSTRPGD